MRAIYVNNAPLLCLSSALYPRYKDDVIRSLAMPRGGRLQFRYETAIVAPHLHDALQNNRLRGTNVLIAHVDCRVTASEAMVIPCRWATLTRSRQSGSFQVMHLEVGAFAHAPDLQAARRELPGDLPGFDVGANRWVGYWCHLLRDTPSAIARSEAIDTWQLIIGQLAQVESFQGEPFFYHVEGMFEPNSDVAASIRDGHYSMRPTTDYDVRIVHYIPHHDEHAANRTHMTHAVFVAVDEPLRLVWHPRLAVDSPYDIKTVRVSTGSVVKKTNAAIRIRRATGEGNNEADLSGELTLPVEVQSNLRRTGSVGALIGLLLSAQQIVGMLARRPTSGGLSTAELLAMALILLVGLGTGLAAAFGLRRPV